MLLNDKQILNLKNNIDPFVPEVIRKNEREEPVISYGLASFAYDLRLSDKDFKIFDRYAGGCSFADPKDFNEELIKTVRLVDNYFLIPAHTYALGTTLERIKMPNNICGLVQGKSTYARVGLMVNVTPIEPSWEGHITLEFFNAGERPLKVYAGEGIVALQFYQGEKPDICYQVRNGKYQNQDEKVEFAKC